MKFGLTKSELEQIYQILRAFPAIKEVLIFGSRATGGYKKTSDIDLALKGNINNEIVAEVKYQLEENTTLPYFFDVINYQKLKNKELKAQIDQEGKILYPASSVS
jgi:predicted nucleotidyltransferase